MSARRGCGEEEKFVHIALTASLSSTGSASKAYTNSLSIGIEITDIERTAQGER